MGDYFGGYAALHAASQLREWVACVVAIAPLQSAPGGLSKPYMPDAKRVQSWDPDQSQGRGLGTLEPAGLVKDLQGLAMMVVEYERDEDSKGPFVANMVPVGCDPEDWPPSLQYVQYAGERKGGGVVRQNMLDLFRRLDSFLHANLSPLVQPTRGLAAAGC